MRYPSLYPTTFARMSLRYRERPDKILLWMKSKSVV
jgi:hypothetical protein